MAADVDERRDPDPKKIGVFRSANESQVTPELRSRTATKVHKIPHHTERGKGVIKRTWLGRQRGFFTKVPSGLVTLQHGITLGNNLI